MVQTTAQQRVSWQEFECNEHKLVDMAFGPGRILVAPPTCDAWRALATVLRLNNYKIRPADTSSYNCREITAGSGKSLHSYGLAVDINASTNPFVLTLDGRAARFSNKATQDERAQEVRLGQADTDMTPQMIADVRAIKTKNGNVVFDWGGNWNDRKDPMHFEVDVSPADLQTGIDWNTVKGADGQPAADVAWGHEGEEAPIHVETFAGELGVFEKCYPAVEKWEGQFLNDPNDPRGPTNMGITQDELARFRERPVTQDELRDLTREEARQILRELYWKPIRADRLPLPVAQVCYDAAVLTGVRRAGRTLQEALNRQGNDLAVDGIIGRATIGAAREADPKRVVDDFAAIQESYLRSRPGFAKYGKGWLSRLADVHSVATAMAAAAPRPAPAPASLPAPVPERVPPAVPVSLPARPAEETIVSDQDVRRTAETVAAPPPAPSPAPFTPSVTPPQTAADGVTLEQLLPVIVAALAAKPGAPTATGAAAVEAAPPVLSDVDKALGGEALAGKKTLIGIIAYVILAILQATGQVGTATGEPYRPPAAQTTAPAPGAATPAPTPTAPAAQTAPATPSAPRQVAAPAQGGGTKTPAGGILTTLIGAFIALGLVGKVDRVVKALGTAAAKPT